MIRFISGMIDRCIGVAGALLLSQAPMYLHQYIHNLSGHVSELKFQIATLRDASKGSGKTLAEYIGKFSGSPDPDFSAQGRWMADLLDRYSDMSTSLITLQDASVWSRPILFLRHCYLDVAEQTLAKFTPGLPFSLEGLAYAALGMFLFSALFWLFKSSIRHLYDTLRKAFRNETPNSRTPIQ